MKKDSFKFTASSAALLPHLQTMLGIIASKRTLPFIDDFLLALEGTTLSITATDLDTTITTTLQVEAHNGAGMVTVPAKVLVKLLRNLPTQHITVVKNTYSSIRVSCETGTYDLTGADPINYPEPYVFVKPSKFTLSASAMSRAIARTLWATGNDDLRPVMHGVFFEVDGKQLHLASTDAHRLVQHRTNVDKPASKASFIVRRRALSIVRKLAAVASGKVTVAYDAQRVAFTVDNTVVSTRTIDGSFPNYRSVIPANSPNQITVARSLFTSALRRMSIFTNGHTQQIIIEADTKAIGLYAEDLDSDNKARETIAGTYKGERIRIAFRASYLLEVLQHLSGDEVTLCMDKPNRAATITEANEEWNESTLSLVMPVLIND